MNSNQALVFNAQGRFLTLDTQHLRSKQASLPWIQFMISQIPQEFEKGMVPNPPKRRRR